MWVSPVPFEILAQQELVQKPCRSASRYRDVLVRRRPGALSAAEVAFINELRREIRRAGADMISCALKRSIPC